MLLQGAVLAQGLSTLPGWGSAQLLAIQRTPAGGLLIYLAQGALQMNQQTPAATGFQEELGLGVWGLCFSLAEETKVLSIRIQA